MSCGLRGICNTTKTKIPFYCFDKSADSSTDTTQPNAQHFLSLPLPLLLLIQQPHTSSHIKSSVFLPTVRTSLRVDCLQVHSQCGVAPRDVQHSAQVRLLLQHALGEVYCL